VNTGIDTLFRVLKIKNEKIDERFARLLQKDKKVILITAHRRESFGQGFINICEALLAIAQNNPDTQLVYPVHLNPNVQDPVNQILKNQPNITLIEPVDYLSFVHLMSKSYLILTDSGGIQEEAPSLGKPVLVMRETTERPEAVEAGTAKLVGIDKNLIINETEKLLRDKEYYKQMANAINPYGDGRATVRIMQIIEHNL
jgi:UDP-N-acetylglucosamine 2-epimerase (non-hydrolysing)